MSVNIKKDGELVKIANNISIVQADWNDRNNTNKNTCIKNQPDTIKTMADLIECQDANALAGAMAVVEALDYQKVGNLYELICDSLGSFVISTATNIETPSIGRFNDPQKSWTPDGNVTHSWYRFIITYQNPYVTGSSLNIYGNGIFWHDDGRMWNVFITGNKDAGLSVKYDLVNKPTIKTRQDLMANAVSGLFPDALAVKDAINTYMPTRYTSNSYSTVDEFVTIMAGKDSELHTMPFKAGSFKDTGSWGPKKLSGFLYRYLIVVQNEYSSGQTYETSCNGFFISGDGEFWSVSIKGKKDTGLTVTYTPLNERLTTNFKNDVVNMILVKYNGVVSFDGSLTIQNTVNDETVLGTLPDTYSPYIGQYINIHNTSTNEYRNVYIRNNGEIKVVSGNLSAGNYSFSGTFVSKIK